MGKRGLSAILSCFLVCFYFIIVLYALFAVVHVDTVINLGIAIVFEIIGIALLACFILGNLITASMKIGYMVPCAMVTFLYVVILDVVNMALIQSMSPALLFFANLIVLFVYCVVVIPMYIMGKR